MRNAPTLGIVVEAAPIAPLRGTLVILLASAVALRRLDWWKLLERAGRLPTRRNQLLVHVAAIGLTFTAADAAEEVAEEEESPLRSAMAHALLRVTLEAALFYTLVTIALAFGLSNGADNHDHQNDLLAYLADAFASGWGEPLVHAIGCVVFIAACEVARVLIAQLLDDALGRLCVVASAAPARLGRRALRVRRHRDARRGTGAIYFPLTAE